MMALIDTRRVSHMIYGSLLQQQSVVDKIERGVISAGNTINMTVINQSSPQGAPSLVQAQLSELRPATKQSTQIINKSNKPLLWAVRSKEGGSSAQVTVLTKEHGTTYQTAVHISLFGKMYSIQLRISYPGLALGRMLHVRNIVPIDSAMTVACKTGDFNRAFQLLTSGSAHGSDVTPGGWPMLDVSTILLREEVHSPHNMSSTLSRVGLQDSSACSSNMELNPTSGTGSTICE